jgi:hypothetical protein
MHLTVKQHLYCQCGTHGKLFKKFISFSANQQLHWKNSIYKKLYELVYACNCKAVFTLER